MTTIIQLPSKHTINITLKYIQIYLIAQILVCIRQLHNILYYFNYDQYCSDCAHFDG